MCGDYYTYFIDKHATHTRVCVNTYPPPHTHTHTSSTHLQMVLSKLHQQVQDGALGRPGDPRDAEVQPVRRLLPGVQRAGALAVASVVRGRSGLAHRGSTHPPTHPHKCMYARVVEESRRPRRRRDRHPQQVVGLRAGWRQLLLLLLLLHLRQRRRRRVLQ